MDFYNVIKKEILDVWDYLGGFFIKDNDGIAEFFFVTGLSYSEAIKAKSGWELSSVQVFFISYTRKWGNKAFIFKKHPELGAALHNYFSTMQCQEQYIYVDKKAGLIQENLDLESPRRKVILNSLLSILSHMPTELKPFIDKKVQAISEEITKLKDTNHDDIAEFESKILLKQLKLVIGVAFVVAFFIAISFSASIGVEPP